MDSEEQSHNTQSTHVSYACNGQYGKAVRTEGVPSARLQVCERVGISQGKVCERVGNLSFQSVNSPKGADRYIACL